MLHRTEFITAVQKRQRWQKVMAQRYQGVPGACVANDESTLSSKRPTASMVDVRPTKQAMITRHQQTCLYVGHRVLHAY